ncbi:hypothetical protein KFK09_025557 [Dendrobium nobile]|uniref:Uncharacterized protein n=1 Tax=Dendrobium nobile TaxID=94219 RepID=A0A8T3A456_DENNO|nr:hypothetical protein KFK09_025557 [Dendrobium nobile]
MQAVVEELPDIIKLLDHIFSLIKWLRNLSQLYFVNPLMPTNTHTHSLSLYFILSTHSCQQTHTLALSLSRFIIDYLISNLDPSSTNLSKHSMINFFKSYRDVILVFNLMPTLYL